MKHDCEFRDLNTLLQKTIPSLEYFHLYIFTNTGSWIYYKKKNVAVIKKRAVLSMKTCIELLFFLLFYTRGKNPFAVTMQLFNMLLFCTESM